MKSALLLRTAERPKYLRRSLESILKRTSSSPYLLCLINGTSKFRESEEVVLGALDQGWEIDYVIEETRLGVGGSVNTGVELLREEADPDVILLCDDDCLVPLPVEFPYVKSGPDGSCYAWNDAPGSEDGILYWDQALVAMLDAGWEFVGHGNRRGRYGDQYRTEVGGVPGYIHTHLGGANTAFRVQDWEDVGGVPERNSPAFGYQAFQKLVAKNELIGYYGPPDMLALHFDLPPNKWSLRDGEYREWAKWMSDNRKLDKTGDDHDEALATEQSPYKIE